MRRDQLPLITLDGQHAAVLLANPCPCDQPRCRTLGQHLLQATRDMTPGPRAQSFEPATTNGNSHPHTDTDPPADPTLTIDTEFAALLHVYWNAARNLTRAIDRLRPDRWTPLAEVATDDQWCRNHLNVMGICETRVRRDMCRSCYDAYCAYGHLPDRELMQARETRGYYQHRDFIEWKTRLPRTGKTKRKKAS